MQGPLPMRGLRSLARRRVHHDGSARGATPASRRRHGRLEPQHRAQRKRQKAQGAGRGLFLAVAGMCIVGTEYSYVQYGVLYLSTSMRVSQYFVLSRAAEERPWCCRSRWTSLPSPSSPLLSAVICLLCLVSRVSFLGRQVAEPSQSIYGVGR
jgi:hypothetical protein